MSTGLATCPCLSGSTTLPNGGTVLLAGKTYDYPASYGLGTCEKHDETLAPYCSVGTGRSPPEWCADTWCYVDKDTCNRVNLKSSYFVDVDLYYSYATCGSLNSFDSWFGANAAADGTHTITDIADLLTGYLTSITNTMEANQAEVAASALKKRQFDEICSAVATMPLQPTHVPACGYSLSPPPLSGR